MSVPEHLEPVVRNLPTLPGCYLYHDAKGEVIYVGKAVNLRNRAGSYFLKAAAEDRRTAELVREIKASEMTIPIKNKR